MTKIQSLLSFLKLNVFKNQFERRYIAFNKSKWKSYKISSKNKILVDLFPFNPWIHFYSFIVNIFSKKLHFFRTFSATLSRPYAPYKVYSRARRFAYAFLLASFLNTNCENIGLMVKKLNFFQKNLSFFSNRSVSAPDAN